MEINLGATTILILTANPPSVGPNATLYFNPGNSVTVQFKGGCHEKFPLFSTILVPVCANTAQTPVENTRTTINNIIFFRKAPSFFYSI